MINELVKACNKAVPTDRVKRELPKLVPEKDNALLSQLLVYDSAVRIGGGLFIKKENSEKKKK